MLADAIRSETYRLLQNRTAVEPLAERTLVDHLVTVCDHAAPF